MDLWVTCVHIGYINLGERVVYDPTMRHSERVMYDPTIRRNDHRPRYMQVVNPGGEPSNQLE